MKACFCLCLLQAYGVINKKMNNYFIKFYGSKIFKMAQTQCLKDYQHFYKTDLENLLAKPKISFIADQFYSSPIIFSIKMNKLTQIPKFTRKSNLPKRQLKVLNSDYYLKVANPDMKTQPSSKKQSNTKESASHRKLYSTDSSNSMKAGKSRDGSKSCKKKLVNSHFIERTRSSTILNRKKSHGQLSLLKKEQPLENVYLRIEKVLEAYQTKIHILQQRNRSLSQQNLRLRAISASNRREKNS